MATRHFNKGAALNHIPSGAPGRAGNHIVLDWFFRALERAWLKAYALSAYTQ